MAAAKKASGRNIAEDERNTERVTVRLDPEAMALLRHYAAAWKCPISEVVSSALDALDNDKAIKAAMTFGASSRVLAGKRITMSISSKSSTVDIRDAIATLQSSENVEQIQIDELVDVLRDRDTDAAREALASLGLSSDEAS